MSEAGVPKRRKVVEELKQTEKDYVTSLQALSWCFLKPLMGEESVLGEDMMREIRVLEPLVDTIRSIHVVFLQDVTKAITAAPLPSIAVIGPHFLQMANYLKTYKDYVGHYQRLVPMFAARKNDASLMALLERLKTKECRGKGIKDFLIMPIQRIPRYNMLIADLVKHTEEGHDDHGPLCAAQTLILSIAEAVENTSKSAENSEKMMSLASRLLFNRIPRIKIIESHRKLMWDLDKVVTALPNVNDSSAAGRFHLYVFNDMLLFATGEPQEAVYVVYYENVLEHTAKDTQGGQGVMELDTEDGPVYVTLPSKELANLEAEVGSYSAISEGEYRTLPISPSPISKKEHVLDLKLDKKRPRRGSLLGSMKESLSKLSPRKSPPVSKASRTASCEQLQRTDRVSRKLSEDPHSPVRTSSLKSLREPESPSRTSGDAEAE